MCLDSIHPKGVEQHMIENLPINSIVGIYLVYGLAFFTMGLTVALEAQRLSSNLPIAQAMLPLAVFGLLHGIHEWIEMFIRETQFHGTQTVPVGVDALRVSVLALSFVALIAFGLKLLYPNQYDFRTEVSIGGGLFSLWIISVLVMALVIHPGEAMRMTVRSWLMMVDTWSRYSLAIPGALISSYALWKTAGTLGWEQQRFTNYLYLASATFFIYGLVGQVFVSKTYLFPSQQINTELFERIVGIPVQLFRAGLAVILALTLIPALNMFELERRRQLEAAQRRARDELTRREELRREMLQHTVAAQEEERRRIARELHDEIGQTLTALSLGLQNVTQMARTNPDALEQRVHDLHKLTSTAVTELSNLVSDLRPSQLDHLGLSAAMRALVAEYRRRFNLNVDLQFTGHRRRLPAEMELAIFRIVQESLTNVVRHARTDRAQVQCCFEPDRVSLSVTDQGIGFEAQESARPDQKPWGLLGMMERATHLNGQLNIQSEPGQGTHIFAQFPLDPSEHDGERTPDGQKDQNPAGR